MSKYKKETLDTYNTEARDIADKFLSIKPREEDIKRAFSFLRSSKENPFVVELGCGNGRDAQVILKFTNNYLGMDFSKNLIGLAKKSLPNANFITDDIETFEFPNNIDLILAFASLLHINKTNLRKVFDRAHNKLNRNGIFYISIKEGQYTRRRETKVHGPRTFFYYDIKTIKEITKNKYEIIYKNKHFFREKIWLTVALRKI